MVYPANRNGRLTGKPGQSIPKRVSLPRPWQTSPHSPSCCRPNRMRHYDPIPLELVLVLGESLDATRGTEKCEATVGTFLQEYLGAGSRASLCSFHAKMTLGFIADEVQVLGGMIMISAKLTYQSEHLTGP